MLLSTASQEKAPVHKLPAPQRREQIIRIAMDLFSRKGFDGTTTREIAWAAGVSEAIIFRHFVTKEELYAAIIDYIIRGYRERFHAEMEQAMSRKDDFAVFQTLAIQILETHRKEPELMRLLLFSGLEGHKLSQLFMETQVRPIYQLVSGYISRRQKDRVFRKANSMVLVRAFMGMVSHHSLIRIIYGDSFLRHGNEEISAEFARILLNGVLIPPTKRKK